ncbi:unnamed protein product [Phytophthora fragariaefolia]|uniref:Unnamed protein product n=1 Tax=Phytophthora fragariaefolia TaxID=1490495 RepID=A0A9W6UEI4_9STRA|nr:unnamed protein product [Phytophthora fragariaefolia]
MEKTAFQKQITNKRVVAIRGSSDVRTTEPTANFHLTVVACGNAAGVMVPLAYILPGKTISSQLTTNLFATLKISELVEEDDDGYFNISMDDAIKVASLAWGGSKVGRNLERGFKACGLFVLSLVRMRARLENFARNAAPRQVQLAAWL